ncbi:MAG: AAA family ATPase [Rudanella sp.]|nr:AAA family ATPase [Rudanella sp.]
MLTKVTIQNFKKLEKVEFTLSQSVVLIGPNNGGKSTIFQALCLWEIGVANFIQAYKKNDLNRQGAVTINRKDLLNSPIADARFLWRNKQVTEKQTSGGVEHVRLTVLLAGETDGIDWSCKAEFTFSNAESIGCKVVSGLKECIRLIDTQKGVHFGFLQPMSGLATEEDLLTPGAVDRRLGEGRTAEVLRNICYSILHPESRTQATDNAQTNWKQLQAAIRKMFGATLHEPEYIRATGLLLLEYTENNIRYDISSGGRGFQQTLLLLAYMYAHPGTILLLDEPDAHLEVIRQREVFQLINTVANETQSQLLIASHSEVVLDEAAEASNIVAIIDSQAIELNPARYQKQIGYLKKALTDIGWERYYLARLKKHILYLEGSTDLEMLKKLANRLKHPVEICLQSANVQYMANNVPHKAIENFVALREFVTDLRGIALFDRVEKNYENNQPPLPVLFWQKRELENYFARPAVLIRHAGLLHGKHPSLNVETLKKTMQDVIEENTTPAALRDLSSNFWNTAKLSDDWLDVIFPEFYKRLGLPQDFYKRDYYQLISLLQSDEIDPEIKEKLDALLLQLKPE